MSERELPYARVKRELRETRHALAVARNEVAALRADADARKVVTQRIALSSGMATIAHPATMTARDVERLSALVALLGTDDERQILHAIGELASPVVALCGLAFDGLDLDAHGFISAGSRHVTCVGCLAARSAHQPPQPLDRVHEPADGAGHVEQRDHAQRGEGEL